MTPWTKTEQKIIAGAIYGAKAMFPTGGEAWSAHVDANAVAFVLADCEGIADMHEKAHAAALATLLPCVRAELAKAQERGFAVPIRSAQERVRWHEKSADEHARKARQYRKLIAKIQQHGLPQVFKAVQKALRVTP